MSSTIRILHLEDDPADARLIRERLRASWLDVSITLVNGREAFEDALAVGEFDVVLSDYRVPRFNGLDALQSVRGSGKLIPFILVTGALGDEGAIELLRSGITDWILKDRLTRLAPAIQRAISEHAAEMAHASMQAKLSEANRLSKLAAVAAHLGTWQLHLPDGKLDCSEEFLDLIKVRASRWGGTIGALRAIMHPEDAALLHRLETEVIGDGRFIELEFRVEVPDGEVRWMYLRGDCSRAEDGVSSLCIGVMMDITERKKLEEALRDADRRKDEFLAALAHELRNPLAPIYNGLSILRRAAISPAEQDNIHAMLDRQMSHVIRLVDDLMEISRYTMGKVQLKRAPTELQTVLRRAVEMSQPLMDAGHHQFEALAPVDLVLLDADAVRLAQVFSNLLINAAKFTPEGGRICLSTRMHGDRVLVSVRDNGIGIPSHMLDRVFDLFTQVDRGQSQGATAVGLGIGLAMVRMLVQMHGGEVEARSAGTGQGSEFIVSLPASVPVVSAAATPDTPHPDGSLTGRRIMVVDDNRDSADSLGMLLSLAGAQVHVAYDGASALAILPDHRPQVVFLDLGMPGMDGFTVAARIRQDSENSSVMLVALTGFGQDQDRDRSRQAGFNAHLTKPAEFNVLQALIASLDQQKDTSELQHTRREAHASMTKSWKA